MRPDFLKLAELDWTEDGQPLSSVYGDVYFSREGGLAESRAVFLAGCGMPQVWHGRTHFTVAELGFGTGLNILALLDLWRRERPAGGHLHIWSVEAHPLWKQALEQAHAAWPDLSDISRQIVDRWPILTPGTHRLSLPDCHATLDLAFGEVEPMLRQWSGRADAWFLDGFAPATNPAMWSDEVLSLVGQRSAPGARAATFTVAGQVRRGLAAAGFEVEKKPGHGRKRERLEAVYPGNRPEASDVRHVAVIGAGIAGAALARALVRLGRSVTVFDAEGPGAGASGAPAALVTPWVDAGLSSASVLAAQAFLLATDLYQRETPQAVIDRGVLKLTRDAADQKRWLTAAGQAIWPSTLISELDAEGAAALVDEPPRQPGVWLMDALTVDPRAILDAWLADAELVQAGVAEIRPGTRPVIVTDDGREQRFDAIIVAAGFGSKALGVEGVSPVRGQLFWADEITAGRAAIWGPGYAIPTRSGTLVGATHDRGRADADIDATDTDRLLARLADARPVLAGKLEGRALMARAAVRAVTADHRPLCGAVGQGVWVLSGLGGRGFMWAPLLAEHLVAEMTATPSPVSADHLPLIAPHRLAASPKAGAQK